MTQVFTPFPRPPGGTQDPAIRLLYQNGQERITNVFGTTLILAHEPIAGSLLLLKNSVQVDVDNPAVCTLAGKTITFTVAAVAEDVYVAYYYYRQAQALN